MKSVQAQFYLALVWTIFCATELPGQVSSDKTPQPSIRVMGEATATARPDQALIDIGVITQAQTAQAAASQNAQRLDAVLGELRKALGQGADIKTTSYSVTPVYRYPKEGGNPTVTGYSVTNVVQVKTNDLAQVGKIIDLATQSGANTVQRLQFSLKDERAVHSQALQEAALKARAKAEAIASALGLKITRVLLVEEGGGFEPRPMQERAFAFAKADVASVPTPVEPGNIEIRATVTLTVAVAP